MKIETLNNRFYKMLFINFLILIIVLSYVFFGNNNDIRTSELSSVNSFWIPSSVMQSVAALYAVFIAIFLLTFQRNEIKISSVANVLKPAFENVSYIIITTICFNGLLLFVLNYFDHFDSRIEILLIFSLISLFISLFSIAFVSFKILSNTVGLKTPEEFFMQIEEDEDRLKLFTEPEDKEGKKAYQTKKLIENIALSAINLQNNETDKLTSYIKSDAYKENELVRTYLEIFETHEIPAIRARTAKLFGKTKIEKSVNLLIKALDDKDVHVRRISAEALGEIKDVRAVEPIIQALIIDTNGAVGESSAKALGKIKDIRAVEPLIKKLKDSHASVRSASAEALGKINDKRAVKPLIQSLYDKDERVRWTAAIALGKMNDTSAVDSLIEKLKDEDSYVQWFAVRALGNIKDLSAVEPLIEKLKDDSTTVIVKHASADALGEIKDKRAVEPLIEAMNKDKEVMGRVEAAEALCKINDLRAVDTFIRNLNDNDIIFYSAMALGKMKDKRAIGPLIKKLNDNDYDFANSEQARDIKSNTNFQDLRKEFNNGIKLELIYALGEIGDENAVESLVKCLNDNGGNTVLRSAEALGKIKDKRAVEPLIKKLNQNNYDFAKSHLEDYSEKHSLNITDCKNILIMDVKLEIVHALGELRDERAVESLIRCLNDNNGSVVFNLVIALGKIKDKRAAEPLINKLNYNDYYFAKSDLENCSKTNDISISDCQNMFINNIKIEIIYVLGEIGDINAIEPLMKILNDDKDDNVRRAVRAALYRIKR